MKDYTSISVLEAARNVISESFIHNIKLLDSEVSQRRLAALLNSNSDRASVLDIMSQFNSVSDSRTSAD